MHIGDLCCRDVHLVKADEPLLEAVGQMHQRHVGSVVVVDRLGAGAQPVGILTDRDVMRAEVTQHADVFSLTVGEVMSTPLLTLKESCDIAEAIELMRRRGVRRAPVIGSGGGLIGVVSFDDLLPAVAAQLDSLARLIGRQARHEN